VSGDAFLLEYVGKDKKIDSSQISTTHKSMFQTVHDNWNTAVLVGENKRVRKSREKAEISSRR
jgi:hypothetical protein